MKHKTSITIILLAMFLLTQFIGLYVVDSYSPSVKIETNPETGEEINVTYYPEENQLPFNLQAPEEQEPNLASIIISFIFAIMLILLLMKYKMVLLIRLWFFVVVIIALSVSFNSFLKMSLVYASLISLIAAIPLAYFKVFRRSIILHNLTELLIYPGIAAVIVPLLGVYSVIALLIIFSIYDMWAVWKSGIMQKMAKFQMEEVKIFGGFLVPYLTKNVRQKIQKLKKSKKKNKGVRMSLAILGGGDIIFPIITAGVFLRELGIVPALFVIFGAFAGLFYLFMITKKNKFYPALPFITAGIFVGALLARIFFI